MKLYDGLLFLWLFLVNCVICQKTPTSVNVGAIFTFDSVIGRVSSKAIDFAVSDINEDSTILNGTKLNFIKEDSNCSVFIGSVEAFQVLEKEVVAIIGPQSSAIGHILAEIANGVKVPLVSFAATDPTLSSLQFPFFLRSTHSDAVQMTAMAGLIEFHGWKEVIAVFVDTEYGRNAISALEDELERRSSRVSFKLALPFHFDEAQISDLLRVSKSLGPRVFVVHVDPDPDLRIFAVAERLGMMNSGYVWFATDWLSSTFDSFSPEKKRSPSSSLIGALRGVVTLRQHFIDSLRKKAFLTRWSDSKSESNLKSKLESDTEINAYGLYAYDTVWTVAKAIDSLITDDGNFSFSFGFNERLHGLSSSESDLQLGKLKVFNGGSLLLKKLTETNFTGVTGPVSFDNQRNILSNGYDIINFDGTPNPRRVGFWSNETGLSISPPETLKLSRNFTFSVLDQKLDNVTWPGGLNERPRGWVIAVDEKPLKIVVPNRTSFVEFVTENTESHEVRGYCIDVFVAASDLVPYDVPFEFVLYGDGHSNPKYDQLVKMVAKDEFDAAVGDITIVKNRTEMVDFSQPYASTGLVIVAPISHPKSNAWVFLKPFTLELWLVTVASFVVIAIVIWALEHRVNDDFRGPPKRQLATMCLFSFSTLFKRNQEDTVSALGRMVMVVWLFLLMVITSSYTASLTSILTVQQLSSPITGIDSLIASNEPIGYQVGSFVYNYLTEILFVPSSRLVSLRTPDEFERKLRLGPENGGVAAIIDELPYVELFLSEQTDFGIIGQPFTRSGWGFAFKRDSPLAVDMSTAILKLSETGKLSEIHKKWFCKNGCPGEKQQNPEPNRLHLISFWGLYLLCGAFSLSALFIFLLRMIWQFIRYKRSHANYLASVSSGSPNSRFSSVLYNFFDFIDEKEEAIKKMFSQSNTETNTHQEL